MVGRSKARTDVLGRGGLSVTSSRVARRAVALCEGGRHPVEAALKFRRGIPRLRSE